MVERDVKDLANITDLVDIPKLLNILASRASGLVNFDHAGSEVDIILEDPRGALLE